MFDDLGGMEYVGDQDHDAEKFASFHALYSCFVMLGVISILMTPAMNRALCIYHADPENNSKLTLSIKKSLNINLIYAG
jgi:hypothetical protein